MTGQCTLSRPEREVVKTLWGYSANIVRKVYISWLYTSILSEYLRMITDNIMWVFSESYAQTQIQAAISVWLVVAY